MTAEQELRVLALRRQLIIETANLLPFYLARCDAVGAGAVMAVLAALETADDTAVLEGAPRLWEGLEMAKRLVRCGGEA